MATLDRWLHYHKFIQKILFIRFDDLIWTNRWTYSNHRTNIATFLDSNPLICQITRIIIYRFELPMINPAFLPRPRSARSYPAASKYFRPFFLARRPRYSQRQFQLVSLAWSFILIPPPLMGCISESVSFARTVPFIVVLFFSIIYS